MKIIRTQKDFDELGEEIRDRVELTGRVILDRMLRVAGGGEICIVAGGDLVVDGGMLRVADGGEVSIYGGGVVRISDGGSLIVSYGGVVRIGADGVIRVDLGGDLVVSDGGDIIDDGGRLRVEGRLVPRLDEDAMRQVASLALADGALDMSGVHACETTHCIAGWACHVLPGGADLESRAGWYAAGMALLGWEAAQHFHDSDDAARQWLAQFVD